MVFLTEKGRPPKILVQKGVGSSYLLSGIIRVYKKTEQI